MDLPEEAREDLVRWQQRTYGEREELRLVARAALHVTLVFLGHLPETEIRPIERLMNAALPDIETPLLTATGVKAVPPRRPRLFALDLDDQAGRAGMVQASISDALETAGLYEPEKRPFWPHVTLARVRANERVAAVEAPPPPAEPWRGGGGAPD